jgi:hypothetical protein
MSWDSSHLNEWEAAPAVSRGSDPPLVALFLFQVALAHSTSICFSAPIAPNLNVCQESSHELENVSWGALALLPAVQAANPLLLSLMPS